jgi:DNA polymerase-3 subunit beta
MAILANVLLDAQGETLSVTASDLEITYRITIPAEVLEPGRVTLPAKPFADIVKSLAWDEVSLRETENHSVVLTSGTFSTNLFGLSPENFPSLAAYDDSALVAVDGRLLADAINKTMSSTVTGDDTYNLSGVNFLKEADERAVLKLVSTDTQRMSLATLIGDDLEKLPIESGVIVPVKGLQELKTMSEDASVVELGVGQNLMVARTDWALLLIRLLEGPFPDYRLVIPVDNDLKAWFYRKELLDAIKRVNTLITGKHSVAKFCFKSGLLTITVMNPELGKAEESVRIEYSGPEVITGFNPGFYLDILTAMASEKIQLAMKEENVSFLFTGPEDPGYLAVVVSSSLTE